MPSRPAYRTDDSLNTTITPVVFFEGDVTRPKGSNRPGRGGSSHQFAPYIPVAWQEASTTHYFCLSTGKLVALDRQGYVVPAGLRVTVDLAIAGGDEGTTELFAYTATDVLAKTMDITTGAYVTTAVTYTVEDVTDALIARGLLPSGSGLDSFFSETVGAVIQTVYSPFSIGDATVPMQLKWANMYLQKGIQFTTSSQMSAPIVPSANETYTLDSGLTGSSLTFGASNAFSAANAKLAQRYSLITATDFVAVSLPHQAIATSTSHGGLVTCSNAAVLVSEKKLDRAIYKTVEEAIAGAVATLRRVGDWFMDYEAGVLFLYSSGGATAVGGGATLNYRRYGASPASVSRYLCVEGELLPGDHVKATANSNFAKWVSGVDAEAKKIGRCYGIVQEPVDLLDRVNSPNGLTGSATGGFTTEVRFAAAADLKAMIVLDAR